MTRPNPTTIAIAAALLLATISLASTKWSAHAADITGLARVVDGDGLRIEGQAIRLCGIDSPELNSRAGRDAKRALERLVTGRNVVCRPVGMGTPCDGRSRDTSYDRIVAQCFAGTTDLAGAMVKGGYARDWPKFSGGFYGDGR